MHSFKGVTRLRLGKTLWGNVCNIGLRVCLHIHHIMYILLQMYTVLKKIHIP